jgi:predicted  nucleic acid-binding Zn-ribbon protein
LREAFGPELESLRGSADGLQEELRLVHQLLGALQTDANQLGERVIAEMAKLRGEVGRLGQEADEISDVVEPLQSATERVGKVAERLPGGGRGR